MAAVRLSQHNEIILPVSLNQNYHNYNIASLAVRLSRYTWNNVDYVVKPAN